MPVLHCKLTRVLILLSYFLPFPLFLLFYHIVLETYSILLIFLRHLIVSSFIPTYFVPEQHAIITTSKTITITSSTGCANSHSIPMTRIAPPTNFPIAAIPEKFPSHAAAIAPTTNINMNAKICIPHTSRFQKYKNKPS